MFILIIMNGFGDLGWCFVVLLVIFEEVMLESFCFVMEVWKVFIN